MDLNVNLELEQLAAPVSINAFIELVKGIVSLPSVEANTQHH
jgi:hypothetical protein